MIITLNPLKFTTHLLSEMHECMSTSKYYWKQTISFLKYYKFNKCINNLRYLDLHLLYGNEKCHHMIITVNLLKCATHLLCETHESVYTSKY